MAYLTINEVAQKLGYSEKTLTHYLSTGHPIRRYFKKIGAKRCMTQKDFDRYIESLPYIEELK